MSAKQTFYHILSNHFIASLTTGLVWFGLTFWIFLKTESVLATSLLAGIFAVANTLSAFAFGKIVDHSLKKKVMLISSVCTLFFFIIAFTIFYNFSLENINSIESTALWIMLSAALLGVVCGNMRSIALTTIVTILFKEEGRAQANGIVGTVNGTSFMLTSILTGVVIGFLNMYTVFLIALIGNLIVILHLYFVPFSQDSKAEKNKHNESQELSQSTLSYISSRPGLWALIFFTTLNNFLGGVFMALMDAYGLSLISVQAWGVLLGFISAAFIAGGLIVAKYGLGKNPLRTMLLVNIAIWISTIIFPLQASVILLVFGMWTWMMLAPIIEASEQTVIQKIVPLERQGRVIGLAQSIESSALPITTFIIGPVAQFFFVPFMTTGIGVTLIGHWFGTGLNRGIGLIFILAGIIGLIVTVIAFYSKSYKILTNEYQK